MNEWGFDELWSGKAVDQLLRGLGIDPRTVAYVVAEQSWSADGHRREVLAVSDVTRRDEVQA